MSTNENENLLSSNNFEDVDSQSVNRYGATRIGSFTESAATDITVGTTNTDRPLFDPIDEAAIEEYDDVEVGAPTQQEMISSFQAAVSLFKGTIGTGILAMPYAFRTSGLWLGVVLVAFAGFISLVCMHQLRNCSQYLRERYNLERSNMDYGETTKAAFKFGPVPLRPHYRKAKGVVNGFIVVVQFGFCCVYVLFMAQNISSFTTMINKDVQLSIYVYASIVLAALLPYCVVKKLRKLTFFSYIANVLTIFGLLLIMIYCWIHMQDYRKFGFANDASLLPISLGIIMYSFESISLVLPIENKMRHPEDYSGFLGVLNVGMIINIVLFILLGFYGYLAFGDETPSSITYSIPITPWIFALVKPLFVVCIFVSYGLQFYVPAYVLLKPIDKRVPDRNKRKWVYRAIKIVMITATYGVAISIPHLDLLISLIGASLSTSLGLIFPPIIDIITYWDTRHENMRKYTLRLIMNITIFIIGVGFCCFGTVMTMEQIVDAFSKNQTSPN